MMSNDSNPEVRSSVFPNLWNDLYLTGFGIDIMKSNILEAMERLEMGSTSPPATIHCINCALERLSILDGQLKYVRNALIEERDRK